MRDITQGFREQFNDNVKRELQQAGSIFQKLVRNEMMQHEVEYFDQIHGSEAFTRDRLTGDAHSQLQDGYDITNKIGADGNYAFRTSKITRRQLSAQQIFWHMSFDSGDKLNIMLEPKSYEMKNMVEAMGRQYDRIILKAFTASVRTGRTGDGLAYFPIDTHIVPVSTPLTIATNAPTVPANTHQGKLTLAKLLKAREILKQDSFASNEKMYFVCSHSQISDLLHDPKITSIDYNNVRSLVSGEISSFLGFEFVICEMLPLILPSNVAGVSYSIRDCYAFTADSIIFGKVKGALTSNIDRLPQHMDAILMKTIDSAGAMRMNDKGVVVVKCLEEYRSNHQNYGSAQAANADGRKADAVSVIPASLMPSGAATFNIADLVGADVTAAKISAIAKKVVVATAMPS